MVRYELLKSVNLTPLVASGIVSINIATWLQIYDYYTNELKKNSKVNSIQFTADYYNISTPTIYRIISFMEN